MASLTAGTTFTDGVANDVTAAKLGALVTNATPTSGFIQDRTAETVVAVNDTLLIGDASDSNNLKRMTVANLLKAPLVSTSGTIDVLTTGTTTSTAEIVTSGTIATLNSTTGTIATLNSTTGTITNLSATTSTFLGTITGSTNVINIGSGQIYKDASGNVGVGTASPSANLHVVKSTSQTDIDNTTQAVSIVNTASDTSGNLTGIRLKQENVTNVAQGYIGLSSTGNSATRANLIIATPNTSGNSTERLRIDSSGNVGIGTTSPISPYQLTTYGTVNGGIAIQNSTNHTGIAQNGNDVYFDIGRGGTAGSLVFRRGSALSESLRIDSSGNVGIGVSPSYKLHASGSAATFAVSGTSYSRLIRLDTDVDNQKKSCITDNIGNRAIVFDNTSSGYTQFHTNGTERLRIDSSGNCSIGTATALSKLHVHGDVTLSNTTTATTAGTGGISKPATYAGFLTVSINGTSRKIPYYAT